MEFQLIIIWARWADMSPPGILWPRFAKMTGWNLPGTYGIFEFVFLRAKFSADTEISRRTVQSIGLLRDRVYSYTEQVREKIQLRPWYLYQQHASA